MYNSPDEIPGGEKIVHQFNEVNRDSDTQSMTVKKIAAIFSLIIVFGIVSGYVGVYLIKGSFGSSIGATGKKKIEEPPAKKAGINDTKTFKDKAEGILKEGGMGGEGDYHLERPGGESQNVYLTSTTVDLSKYIDKKVKVQGETYSAEKAGWLMDVGLIELSQ